MIDTTLDGDSKVTRVPTTSLYPTRFIKTVTMECHGNMAIHSTVSYDTDFVRYSMGLHPDVNADDAARLDRHIMMNIAVAGVLPTGLWTEEGIRDQKAA